MKSIKILLIDAEAIILSGRKYSLESACNFVKTEFCGKRTSEIVAEKKPDLVITDLIMQKTNGVEVCRKIKARYPNIEAVLISGSPDAIRKYIQDILYADI